MTATPPPASIKHRLEAAAAGLMLRGLGRRDMAAISAFGGRLARALGPRSGADRVARRNIALAFPDLDETARAGLIDAVWENFGRTMTEYAVLPRLWPEAWRERVAVAGHEPLAALAAQGKPALLFTGHIGNWELIPLALAQAARPLLIVYRPPNNRIVDRLIGDIRRPYTAAMAPKGAAGARMILKGLGRGEHVFMVVDQKINTGLEIPFFGRGAFTGPAIVTFALRFRCPVFPVRCVRTDGFRFRISVEEPWTFEGDEDDEGALRAGLLRVNQRLEQWIREFPAQWLWMHKRWPT